MRKMRITAIMFLVLVIMTGCSNSDTEKLKKYNSFTSFSVRQTKNDYQNDYHMKGTAYLSSERDLINLDILSDTEITLKGTLKEQEGEIKLLYEDTSGNITTLLNSEDTKEKTIKVDIPIFLKAGDGRIYLYGTSCIYDFDFKFSLNDDVDYLEE